MTDLSLESTDDLLFELERRTKSYVFVASGLPDSDDGDTPSAFWNGTHGSVNWLIDLAKYQIMQRAHAEPETQEDTS